MRHSLTSLAFIVMAAGSVVIGAEACKAKSTAVSDSVKTTPVVKPDSAAAATVVAPAEKVLVEQKTCPVMGSPINKDLFVDYNGQRIYICCGGCVAAVKADPEKCIKKLADLGEKPGVVPAKK